MRWQKLYLLLALPSSLIIYSDSPVQGPIALLSKADRLAMLYNWPEAASLYAQTESLFAQSGDRENRFSARLGYIWATADSGVSAAALKEVSTYLADPLVQANPKLLLRALIAKAVLDRNQNENAARETWECILDLATRLNEQSWKAQAKAEIGQILYLDGDIKTAAAMLREAILSLYLHLDWGAAIHYTAMVGNGFVEVGQPEAGLQYCNIALRASVEAQGEINRIQLALMHQTNREQRQCCSTSCLLRNNSFHLHLRRFLRSNLRLTAAGRSRSATFKHHSIGTRCFWSTCLAKRSPIA